jgi:hypothetical protein
MAWIVEDQIRSNIAKAGNRDDMTNPAKACKLKVGDLEVSASISEIHGLKADVTDEPTEEGNVTDNIAKRPAELQIEGIVSDVDIDVGQSSQNYTEYKTSPENGRALQAWRVVQRYFEEEKPIKIITAVKTYPVVGLTSFEMTRTKGNGTSAVRFSLTGKALTITYAETVDAIAPLDEAIKKKAKSKAEKAKKNGSKAKTDAASKSLSAKVLDSVFG